MVSLGTLGRQRQPIDMDFDWFGQTIRVHPMASDLVEYDFIERAASIDLAGLDLDKIRADGQITADNIGDLQKLVAASQAASQAQMASIKNLIHPDDWDRFWKLAIDNGQNLDDLAQVQRTITAALADFPTGPPSDSSDGRTPPETAPSSTAASLLRAPVTDADKALAAWRGRPDLQEFVVMQEEAEKQRALSSQS